MVEYNPKLDMVFQSLADSTRRDIIKRVAIRELSITELASDYKMSFAAVAKHISYLDRANLIKKIKRGKQRIITAHPTSIAEASRYLDQYEKLWSDRLDRLENLMVKE